MATDQNQATVTTTSEVGNEPEKVTFTDAQQQKIQELINVAVSRTSKTVRTEHEARVAELNAQLEALKASPKKGGEDDKAAKEEFKNIVEAAKAETERYRQAAQEQQRELQAAKAESQEVRKEVAIATATSKIPFFNADVVKTLTKDSVVFDSEYNQYVVKGANGQVRFDSSLEKPLSLDAYYAEYAANNKYLVRSELPSGTGSHEATRTNVSSNGRFAVTDIFGPKSSSQKAASLHKENPAEYARLKGIAKAEGLLA